MYVNGSTLSARFRFNVQFPTLNPKYQNNIPYTKWRAGANANQFVLTVTTPGDCDSNANLLTKALTDIANNWATLSTGRLTAAGAKVRLCSL